MEWADIHGALRPELIAETPQKRSDISRRLRVVTFNVHHGEDVEGVVSAFKSNPALALADIVFLQEIQSYSSEGRSRAARIAERLEMAYAYAPAKEFQKGAETGTHGNAILSRFQLRRVRVMELPRGPLVVNEERRIALTAEILTSYGRVSLVNVHLDTRLNLKGRILQLRPAIRDLAGPAVVAGDFNSNPVTWAFNLIPVVPLAGTQASDQAAGLDQYLKSQGFLTPTSSFGSTVEFLNLKPRLDSIFIRGLSAHEGAVERGVSVSDHWPLWLDVEITG